MLLSSYYIVLRWHRSLEAADGWQVSSHFRCGKHRTMGRERAFTAAESWLSGLCRQHKDQSRSEKEVIGILCFEVASLMSKLVKVWRGLSDLEILRLKSEILHSAGVRNLVSKDESCLMDMVLDETLDTLVYVARAVVRLSKRCSDPAYHHIERLFISPLQHRAEWSGWAYKWKKMDRRAKKMERFIGAAIQLHEEQEALAESEQTLQRLRANPELDQGKVFEFEQKVVYCQRKVQSFRESSPWCRSYDYIIRLLLRSISTILKKVKYTFGCNQELAVADRERNAYLCFSKNYSIPALVPSLLYPSEYNFNDWCVASPLPEKDVATKRQNTGYPWNLHPRHLSQVAPFKGCMLVVTDSPVITSSKSKSSGSSDLVVGDDMGIWNEDDLWLFIANTKILWRLVSLYSKCCRFSPPPGTLGHAALAVHYANIIIKIEKLAYSPNFVRIDSKEDLYEMLPSSVRTALRTRLRPLNTAETTAADLDAEKQRNNLMHVLRWISPLAHDTIKWHSEQGFEKQVQGCAANMLLVQTLYFANQVKTEAAIVQLLVDLSVLCKGKR